MSLRGQSRPLVPKLLLSAHEWTSALSHSFPESTQSRAKSAPKNELPRDFLVPELRSQNS